jgi:putative membrane protein
MSWRAYHRWQAFICIGWGLFILDRIFSGRVLFYINRRYVALILITALAFLGLAQAVFIEMMRSREKNVQLAQGHTGEHHHGSRPASWGLFILALPLILGMVIPPRPLSSALVASRGVNAIAPLGKLASISTTSINLPTTERSVLDWVGEFDGVSDPSSYTGQLADVTGFVYHDPRLPKNQFLVSRFIITCCVADAVALGMVVDWPAAATLTENSWVEVQGEITVAALNGQSMPGIRAKQVAPISIPDQPYLFP